MMLYRISAHAVRAACLLVMLCSSPAHASLDAPAAGPSDLEVLRVKAEQGDPRASLSLGKGYATGEAGLQDDSEAVRWLERAADAGLAEAQYQLAIMYASGRGVDRDLKATVRWVRAAAEQGLPEAQFNLGTLYISGRGVEKDETKGMAWLSRAAEQGMAEAQYNLGLMFEYGYGVQPDPEKALTWYRLARAQNFERAEGAVARVEQALGKKSVSMTRHAGIDAVASNRNEKGPAEAPARAAVSAPAPKELSSVPALPVEMNGDHSSKAVPEVERWVRIQDPGRYTLQLFSATQPSNAASFMQRFELTEDAGLYRHRTDGRLWYAVVYGVFDTYDEAVSAKDSLPPALSKGQPWVRNFARIHRAMVE